ncbi:MAG: polyprenol monophosphomannose synthase [Deltaproteobacteria bacterium]|nr:polyprenol monophosphomannose synthase [Deltaproteobacteria bacterium]
MSKHNKHLLIVPTFNEAANIKRLLKKLAVNAPFVDLLVVDDSSPDGTADIVRNYQKKNSNVHLLLQPHKMGLARAYIEGFLWGLARDYEAFIQMDADFSHDPRDLKRFFQELQNYDLVIGCRYANGGGIAGWSWLREGISRGGNVYARTILQLPYHDLTGGFNGWRRKVLESIGVQHIRSQGYVFQVELKYRAHQAGFSIHEIPIIFRDRELGKSKMTGLVVWEAAFRVLQMRLTRNNVVRKKHSSQDRDAQRKNSRA